MNIYCTTCGKQIPFTLESFYWYIKTTASKTIEDTIQFNKTKRDAADYDLILADFNDFSKNGLVYCYKYDELHLNQNVLMHFCSNKCAYSFVEGKKGVLLYRNNTMKGVRGITPHMRAINQALGTTSDPYRGLATSIPSIWVEGFQYLQQYINAGLEHMDCQRYYEAIESFLFVLRFGNIPMILNHVGFCNAELGRYKEAIPFFLKSIDNNQGEMNIAGIHSSIATCYDNLLLFNDSLNHYNLAIEFDPYNGKFYACRAQVKKHLGIASYELDLSRARQLGFNKTFNF